MIEHTYSNQFGTFLLNSTRERSQVNIFGVNNLIFLIHFKSVLWFLNIITNLLIKTLFRFGLGWPWWMLVVMFFIILTIIVIFILGKTLGKFNYLSIIWFSVIYPKYYQTCLEIWRTHYDKHNVRMVVT